MHSGCLKIATIEVKETLPNPKASRKASCIRLASTTRLSREAMKLRARQRETMVGDTVALGEEAVAGIEKPKVISMMAKITRVASLRVTGTGR